VADRAAHGLFAFTASTEGLGMIALAKPKSMSVDRGCSTIDCDDTDRTRPGWHRRQAEKCMSNATAVFMVAL
jgi:hypothetical protein